MPATHARTPILMMAIALGAGARAEDAGERFGAVLTAFDALARPGEVADVRAKLEHAGVAGIHPHLRGYAADLLGRRAGSRGGHGRGGGRDGPRPDAPVAPGGVARVRGPLRRQPAPPPGRGDGARLRLAGGSRRRWSWTSTGRSPTCRMRDVLFVGNAAIPAVAGAVEALTRLARTHRIIYLTARDESLYNKTRAWLELRGFPEGPLFTRDYNVLGPGRGAFKRRFLVDLRKRFPGVAAGVTDTPADAQAYLDAGLKAIALGPDARRFPPGAVVVPAWQAACKALDPASP